MCAWHCSLNEWRSAYLPGIMCELPANLCPDYESRVRLALALADGSYDLARGLYPIYARLEARGK